MNPMQSNYFTVKDIFPRLDLPEEQVKEHRLLVGRSIKTSYKTRYPDKRYEKVVEEDYQVIAYPSEFKASAEKVLRRYIKKYQLPLRHRKRIIKTNQLVTV